MSQSGTTLHSGGAGMSQSGSTLLSGGAGMSQSSTTLIIAVPDEVFLAALCSQVVLE